MGNSVIYTKPYDAEVEYLESTGTQYIDTLLKANTTTSQFECEIIPTNVNGTQAIFGSRNIVNSADDSSCNIFIISAKFRVDWLAGSGIFSDTIYANTSYIISITRGEYILNGTSHTYSNSTSVNQNYNFLIGNFSNGSTEPYHTSFIGKWKWAKLYDNGNLIFDGIPVRVGSVGYMYDKISGRLFGNKGTGNFILGNDVSNAVIPQQRCVLYFGNQRSVIYERIYEEYEWLKGDGVAYIDTLVSDLTNVRNIYCKIKRPSDVSEIYNQRVFGRENSSGYSGTRFVVRPYDNHLELYTSTIAYTLFTDNVDYINIDAESNSASTSQQSKTIEDIKKNGISLGLFADHTTTSYFGAFYKGSIGEFTIDSSMQLIPCRLLRPIPASLDANGIARQAGECGMWDKVSNRFYGNVASSGTFTVKGPKCYEEYKWLEVEMPPKCYTCNLPINSENFSYSRKYTQIGNTTHLIASNNYTYFSADLIGVGIWDGTQTINYRSMSINNLEIACTSDKLLINSIEFPKYGIPVTLSLYNVSGSATTLCKQSKVIIDNAVHYVPCKLTHGIPASMDANGIARPAGTCGMWDKVNDKFYGNVASSGSFTVSND